MDIQVNTVLNSDDGSILKKVKHNEEIMNADFEKSSSLAGSSGSLNSDTVFPESSYHEGDDDDSDYGDDDDGDDDYMFDNDDDNDDYYLSMQAQFDNVDLPPGVEASVSWLKDPSPDTSVPLAATTSATSLSAEAGTSNGITVPNVPLNNSKDIAVSEGKEPKSDKEAQIMQKFEQFKRFDVVDDFSDHHYIREGLNGQQPPRNWAKKIQSEWKLLEENLPDTIYVRACEKRMDLLRAVIVGPAGTPYHDGLFTFDAVFPPTYPAIPPMVYYYAGGLRLNPNLYDNGKVCLSLLGTWSGNGCEKWMPNQSTMLQVLVSIQALILNSKPFFNEPGHDSYTGVQGQKKSDQYNEQVFILSLKTMMYTLRRPPKYFEDLIAGHFRLRAHTILSACKAYMEGARVGSAANVSDPNDCTTSSSKDFRESVGKMFNGLITNFTRHAAVNCEEFRIPS